MDVRHKFSRKISTGTASEHDSMHFDDVLDEHNTSPAMSMPTEMPPARSAVR